MIYSDMSIDLLEILSQKLNFSDFCTVNYMCIRTGHDSLADLTHLVVVKIDTQNENEAKKTICHYCTIYIFDAADLSLS